MIDLAMIFKLAFGRPRRECTQFLGLTQFLGSTQFLAQFLGLAVVWFSPAMLLSQEPFGAGDPFASPDPAADVTAASPAPALVPNASAAPIADDEDPLVRILRANPPKTTAEFAETLEWMVRIRRWDEVGRYLDQIQRAGWTRDQLADLSQAGGASLWSRLRGAASELSDAQRNFVREVAALPAQLARDPQWIDGWINQLAATTAGERREAQLRLLRAQRAAVARLSLHLLASHPRVSGVMLVEALLEFDADGIDALRAACIVHDADARTRALLAIAQSTSSEFGVEMGSGLYASDLSIDARAALSKALSQKYGKLPTSVSIYDFIVARFKRQLDDYQLARAQPARLPVSVWRIGPDGRSIVATETASPDRSLETLAQLASHRIRFDMRSHEDTIDCAAVLLQHAYQSQPGVVIADPAWQPLAELPEEATGRDFWKQVLDRSQNWQMHGAAIRASQAIGRELATSIPGASSFDFIAGCLRDSRPVIRYIAVDAIARADLRAPYNGSASALEVAVEMSRLREGPMVLVVGLTSDLRLAAEQQLAAIGAHSIAVNSTQAALQVLDQPYPIELIMIVDRVPRNSTLTLVDRLRHSRRGGSLPIAILTEDLLPIEHSELSRTPGIVFSVLSEQADQMPRVIQEMERRLDVRPLLGAERAAFAESATTLLAKIASDRPTYSFYALARWEKELVALADLLPTELWLTLLGGLGTVESQEQLLIIASDKSASADSRSGAANAFARSTNEFGLLLSRPAILKAYELYNSQGPNDPVTVSALGRVLDAIETRTGKGLIDPAP